MANIQEYNSEVEAPGAVGALSPNMGEVDAVGSAIQNVGRAADQASDIIYKRNAQKESTQAYATFSKARADAYGSVNQAMQDGTLTPDSGKKIMDDYQQFVQDQSDQYSTAIGKNYFTRQAARLQGSLQQKVAAGIAHVSGQQEAQLIDQAAGTDRMAIQQDPDKFEDVLHSAYEMLDSKSTENGGPLTPALMIKARKQMADDYAMTAIRSLSTMSPDVAQASLDSGYFTQHLDNTQMGEAQRIVEQSRRASEAQARSIKKQEDDQSSITMETANDEHLREAYSQGGLNLQKVLNDDRLDFAAKNKLIAVGKQAAEASQVVDPRVENKIISRIYSPDNAEGHISAPSQITDMVASGQIKGSPKKYLDLLATTPDQKELNFQRATVMKQANQTLGYASNPFIPGRTKDPAGDFKVQQFHNAMLAAEQDAIAAGGKAKDIYDPNNKNYILNGINKYKTSHPEVLNQLVQDKAGAALGYQPSPTPANIDNTPGVPPVAPTPAAAKSKVPPAIQNSARKPGESLDDFFKRTGK